MSLIICKECGKEVSENAVSCPHCGSPIKEKTETKFCKHCGSSIDKECVICPKCGKQVEELHTYDKNIVINNNNNSSSAASASATVAAATNVRQKNKWVAFWLCLFFGGIGVHKFYEGKILLGVIYIFTLGFFGIGALIDLIVILCKPHYYY
jgi:restriction system protein